MHGLQKIIDGGYCIGCGACAFAGKDSIELIEDEYRQYQARIKPDAKEADLDAALAVCPFSNEGPNEDQIGKNLFGGNCNHDVRLGYYRALYAGHVLEGEFRNNGTSGGVITWVCSELLRTDSVDHVIHVKPANTNNANRLFEYSVSSNREELYRGSKSRYYPVEMSEVLQLIRNQPGRYVIVGLPCFIKAVRRLMLIDNEIGERIKFCVGLVCGHLKSKAFADCFAWQAGIPPGALEHIDFRVKLPDRNAGSYGVFLKGANVEATAVSRSFFGSWWGHNFFRYEACSFCDDVFSETADIVVGDAWLRNYIKDPLGNSVVVVRNEEIHQLIRDGIERNALNVNVESPDAIASSQAGGLRDRRDGLAYRLYRQKKRGDYRIKKRVEPSLQRNTLKRRQIYAIRLLLEKASHRYWKEAVGKDNFNYFRRKMNVYIMIDALLPGNIVRNAKRKLAPIIRRFIKKKTA